MRRGLKSWALLVLLGALGGCESTRFREVSVDPAIPSAPPPAAVEPLSKRALRVSVAAIESPSDTYVMYSRLFRRMSERLQMQVEFVQRDTYRKVNDLLVSGKVDAALLCTGGYLDLEQRAPGAVEVLAVPVTDGEPTYRSLIIVPADGVRSLEALRGKRFAYSDELSFSGRAYAKWVLRRAGIDPRTFFGSTLFTQNHDRSVRAVAAGVVDGAAVHGRILTHLIGEDPALADRVRVLHESPPFGAMPLVVSTSLPAEFRAHLRAVLLSLHQDPEAGLALSTLGLDYFVLPPPGLYDTARQVMAELP
jgi:phosphonate transport system substrate-binding protein